MPHRNQTQQSANCVHNQMTVAIFTSISCDSIKHEGRQCSVKFESQGYLSVFISLFICLARPLWRLIPDPWAAEGSGVFLINWDIWLLWCGINKLYLAFEPDSQNLKNVTADICPWHQCAYLLFCLKVLIQCSHKAKPWESCGDILYSNMTMIMTILLI